MTGARTVGTRVLVLAALALTCGAAAAAAAEPSPAWREDRGGIIVLHLAGDYRMMGRQATALLGDEARVAEQLYRERWRRLIATRGVQGWFEDLLFPNLWSLTGRWWEASGMFQELAGIGDALDVGATEAVRGFYGGIFGGGSTGFVATGGATVGGNVILGRNVDWSDDRGVRRPVVTYYHPTNGDLDFLAVGWMASPLPIVGMNSAGLVVSLNFFAADDIVARWVPQIVYRRVLQRARTIDEAAALMAAAPNRGGATLMLLADAGGRFAVWECVSVGCERYDPGVDRAGLTNHARTPAMIAHDRGRIPDSFRRLAAVEAAVRPRLGRIDPTAAAAVLRDRSNSPYANDSTVANLRVLNSLVVEPATRTLWHAVSVQPEAPFGEMVPFRLADDGAPVASLPADPRWSDGRLARERRVITEMRHAARRLEDGDAAGAGAIYDRIARDGDGIVDPRRLRWARARARFAGGDLQDAEELLVPLDDPAVPFDVQVYGLVALGLVRDRLEQRAQALAAYERARVVLAMRPESLNAGFFAVARRWIDDGRRRAQCGPMPSTPDLQMVSP